MPGVTADEEEEERKGTNTTNTTIATINGSNRKSKVGVFMVVGGGVCVAEVPRLSTRPPPPSCTLPPHPQLLYLLVPHRFGSHTRLVVCTVQ